MAMGGVIGGGSAYVSAKANGVDPWTGKIDRYPLNDGFNGKAESFTLKSGDIIDRYGPDTGRYASPNGTSFSQRSLNPFESRGQVLNTYKVIKPIPVLRGKIAPWFFQKGGGIQYKFKFSLKKYIDAGYIIKK